jgi:nitrite reductase/ring-hydroxylating ferredoxin subunit
MLNITATACYGASGVLRGRGARTPGIVLSTTGLVITSVSGLLGGDLAYKLGIGVSRVAFEEPAGDWAAVIGIAELEDGTLKRVENDGEPLVLLKVGDTVYAASATCTHVGGPLDEGQLSGTCVTCPWHGSEFDLRDGRVIHGPATAPIHAYEARVTDGQVEIRVNVPS